MAEKSAYNEIKRKVKSSKRGTLFFPDLFAYTASSDAVRSALVRLCKGRDIIRVAQGIYCYPKIDAKCESGFITPSVEEIAEGIANRDKVRIAPTGVYAMILLGLSSQMPSDIVFVTDGSSRKVSLGNGKSIMFKHTSEMRTFAYRSRLMLLIVMALREIGERNVTEQQMNIIKCHLEKVPANDFQKDILLAPIWVRKKLQRQ